jgi:hypothetical protein
MFSIPDSQINRHGLTEPYCPRKRIRWLQKQNRRFAGRVQAKRTGEHSKNPIPCSASRSIANQKPKIENSPTSHFWLKEPASDLPPNVPKNKPQYAFLFWLVRSDTKQPVGLVRAIPRDRNKFPCHHPYRAAWLSGDTVETRHHNSLQSSRTYLERKFIGNYSGQRFPILSSETLGIHFARPSALSDSA